MTKTKHLLARMMRTPKPWYHKQFGAHPLTLGLVGTGLFQSAAFLQQLKKTKGPWYHKQHPAFPLTLGLVDTGIVGKARENLPWGPSIGACLYERNIAHWYWNYPELHIHRKKIIARHLRDPRFIGSIDSARERADRRFEAARGHFLSANLQALADAELWELYEPVVLPFLDLWGWGYISEPFLGTTENWLATALESELKEKFGKEWGRALLTVATPTTPSFVSEEHRSLLHIAKSVARMSLRAKRSTVVEEILTHPALRRMLVAHTRSYAWIEDNYDRCRFFDIRTFAERAYAAVSAGNPTQELRIAFQRQRATRREKQRIVRRLSPRARALVSLSDTLARFADRRKSSVFRMARVWFSLVVELERRHRISAREFLALTAEELKYFLTTGAIDRHELRQRMHSCLIVYSTRHEAIVSGVGMKDFDRAWFEPRVAPRSIRELRGVAASSGKVQGNVRVITTTAELPKFRKGEVLIANQTTPDFVSAMRRAAAIVTDQGGITSHTAVVSRELGKPCIIGTEIASRVFKTGDRVEVDASAGIVRRI